jgi:hypothetical protein
MIIDTSLPGHYFLPAWGVVTLHFVPEPATGLLVGLGVAVLAAGGPRVRRRQARS